jgi:MFS family permease
MRKMVLAEMTERAGSSFGWKVVWAAFLVAVFGWGVGFYGPSVFLRTLHADKGWAISGISAAITTHFLLSAVLVARLPEAYRRFGVARVTQAGIAFAVFGILAWAGAQRPWQLFAAALLSGIGWAATSGAAINAMVAPWFDKDRPKALSLAFNGASIGGLVFTPLWVVLIGEFGFVSAAILVGIAIAIVLLPVSERFLRPQPAGDMTAPARAAPTLDRSALLRDRRFVTISAAFALGLFAQIGLFAHLLTRLTPAFGPDGAAWAISLATICAVAGRTILGWVLGEDNRRLAAAANFVVQACGTALLTIASDVPLLLCGCVLFGLGVGNLVSLPPLIIQKEFPAADVGHAVALTVAINQGIFAFAPAILGLVRDIEGDYTVAFAVAAAIQLSAALIVTAYRTKPAVIAEAGGGR